MREPRAVSPDPSSPRRGAARAAPDVKLWDAKRPPGGTWQSRHAVPDSNLRDAKRPPDCTWQSRHALPNSNPRGREAPCCRHMAEPPGRQAPSWRHMAQPPAPGRAATLRAAALCSHAKRPLIRTRQRRKRTPQAHIGQPATRRQTLPPRRHSTPPADPSRDPSHAPPELARHPCGARRDRDRSSRVKKSGWG